MKDNHCVCDTCMLAEHCQLLDGDNDLCDTMLMNQIEADRDEFYRAWIEYIEEYQ